MQLARYFLQKIGWYLLVFVVALLLNFILPASSRAIRSTPRRPDDPGWRGEWRRSQGDLRELHARVRTRPTDVATVPDLRRQRAAGQPGHVVRAVSGIGELTDRPGVALEHRDPAPGDHRRLGRREHRGCHRRLPGRLVRPGIFLSSLFLSSIPPYCLAIILLFVVAVQGGFLQSAGRTPSGSARSSRWPSSVTPSPTSGCRSGRSCWSSSAARRSACARWPSTRTARTTSTTAAAWA